MGAVGFFAYILVLAVAIWINYLIAREFYRVAMAKGFHAKKYLWIPFWLGLVGYLLVIALPTKRIEVSSFAEENQYVPRFLKRTTQNPMKVCPECKKEIPEQSKICPACGYPF